MIYSNKTDVSNEIFYNLDKHFFLQQSPIRGMGSIEYTTICLVVYDLPDIESNLYQRVKIVADFGNFENTENFKNAHIALECFHSTAKEIK